MKQGAIAAKMFTNVLESVGYSQEKEGKKYGTQLIAHSYAELPLRLCITGLENSSAQVPGTVWNWKIPEQNITVTSQ